MSERSRLLIFDFDGVLADTEDLHYAAFAAVLHRDGIELTRAEYYRRYLGLPDGVCIASSFETRLRRLSADEVEERVRHKRAEFAARAAEARLYPGVAETLRQLHPRRLLAIASGAFRDEIEGVLARGGVRDLFAAVVAAEDVREGKPAPEPFLRALDGVNRRLPAPLTPAQCVVIEDAPHGIAAARAAGMRCIAVATSHDAGVLQDAEAVIEDVTRLARSPELLA
jgi:HAD superfamily hydrolase (TIGR01509 family)